MLSYFTLKALFVFKILNFKFCFLDFLVSLDHRKRLDYKDKVNFKIYGVTTRETNNGNTHTEVAKANQTNLVG